MSTRSSALIALFALGACRAGVPPERPEAAALRLAKQMEREISARDVDAMLTGIDETDHVLYVSNGSVTTGREFGATMRRYYGSIRDQQFRWDRWDIQAAGPSAAVFTGWATATVIDADGVSSSTRLIFTITYAATPRGWRPIVVHKSRLAEDG